MAMEQDLLRNPAVDPPQEQDRSVDRSSLGQEVRGWARDILFTALIAILVVIFVVQPVKVLRRQAGRHRCILVPEG
jgi:hypothetical protein